MLEQSEAREVNVLVEKFSLEENRPDIFEPRDVIGCPFIGTELWETKGVWKASLDGRPEVFLTEK